MLAPTRSRSDLDAAEIARSKAGSAVAEAQDQLSGVRAEATEIIEAARAEAEAERGRCDRRRRGRSSTDSCRRRRRDQRSAGRRDGRGSPAGRRVRHRCCISSHEPSDRAERRSARRRPVPLQPELRTIMLSILASEEPNGVHLASDINEVIWGSLAFFVLLALIVWKAGPAIKAAISGRTDRIRDELATAEAERSDAEAALTAKAADLPDVSTEQTRIRAEATETAARLKSDMAAKAQADAAALVARANGEVVNQRTPGAGRHPRRGRPPHPRRHRGRRHRLSRRRRSVRPDRSVHQPGRPELISSR